MTDGSSKQEKMFYSVHDLEARWGVSRSTIDRLAKDGRIKRTRIRGSVRFSAATIMAFERKVG